MAQDWIYYDTQDVSTTNNVDIEFFANEEGVDGIHITNLSSKNEIPENEEFVVEEIITFPTPDIETNDIYELYEEGMVEFMISGNRQLIVPAILCGCPARYEQTAEDVADAGTDSSCTPYGSGYKLRKPIVLRGGVPFAVKFRTGTTAAGAGDSIIIALKGQLTRR